MSSSPFAKARKRPTNPRTWDKPQQIVAQGYSRAYSTQFHNKVVYRKFNSTTIKICFWIMLRHKVILATQWLRCISFLPAWILS